jgi:hypothetical protein
MLTKDGVHPKVFRSLSHAQKSLIPAGERQLRYFVSPQNFGVDEINALSKQVQANVLEAFGLAADTKFLKGKAVGTV